MLHFHYFIIIFVVSPSRTIPFWVILYQAHNSCEHTVRQHTRRCNDVIYTGTGTLHYTLAGTLCPPFQALGNPGRVDGRGTCQSNTNTV